jgi:hypothetical protein
VPVASVLGVCLFALILTLPALWNVEGSGVPVAWYAVTSIGTIDLYIAYVTPVFLRWRAGSAFKPGAWTLGNKYKWMNLMATAWVGICVIVFSLPFTPAAVPWNDAFAWAAVNYALPVNLALIILIGLWWVIGAKNRYTGPIRTIEWDEAAGVVDDEAAEPGGAAPAPAS